jgi:hypothetical protein
MANFAQGKYQVKNPQKYVGKSVPKYRSGWELTFMMFCDNHDSVLQWASESVQIPYRNPLTGKNTIYVPDFFVLYKDKFGKQKAEIVEIKPKKQTLIESRVTSARDKAAVVLNHAKWGAAMAYCKRIGCTFRVITEDDLFYKGKR